MKNTHKKLVSYIYYQLRHYIVFHKSAEGVNTYDNGKYRVPYELELQGFGSYPTLEFRFDENSVFFENVRKLIMRDGSDGYVTIFIYTHDTDCESERDGTVTLKGWFNFELDVIG